MAKQLDLLLVNPAGRHAVYQGLQDAEITAVETPVWAGLIAGFVRKHGFTVELLDANAEGYITHTAVGYANAANPKLTAVVCYGQQPSASTQTMPAAIELAKELKRDGHKVIMVGGHVAALPQRTLEESGADYVATGEGCHTILDLLQGKNVNAGDVRGLGFHQMLKVVGIDEPCNAYCETNAAPNVEDVNDLKMAWDLLPVERYRAHNWQCLGGWPRTPYAALYTSLGCPYKCHFCCIQAPFREGDALNLKSLPVAMKVDKEPPNSYRLWSPDGVGQQIADLYYKHGCRTFKVADEMFVLNKRHVEGVCDAILRRIANPGGPDGINIWAYARVDTANDEGLLAKMRSAGFRWLCLGIESASESVRDGIDKGYAQDKIARCVERIKRAGIHVLANYIVGLPGDTLESMQQTLDLAIELNTPWMNVYASMPYPGSPMWHDHPEHHDLPWSAFSQHSYDTHPTKTATLSSAAVLEFRDHFWRTYFEGQRYLGLAGNLWGQGAVDEVKAMTKHRLKRKLLEVPA